MLLSEYFCRITHVFAGVCENVIGVPNEFVCKCQGDYRGRRCEYGKFCLPNPCKHGGTCIEGPASFNCICQPGFTGEPGV